MRTPALAFIAVAAWSQPPILPPQIRFVATDPSGSCGNSYVTINTSTGNLGRCVNGTWSIASLSASSGLNALTVGSSLMSGSTITPVQPISHVTGTTQITTITAPASFATSGFGGCLTLIPDGAWSLGTGGNINNFVQAVVGKSMNLCYDNGTSKWYPLYTGIAEFTWACAGAVSAATTLSLQPGFGAACTDTTLGDSAQLSVFTGIVSNLSVIMINAAVHNIAVTVFKNGSSQALTCTVAPTAFTCTDTAHSFSVAPGDYVQIQYVTLAGETAGGVHASVGLSY